MTPEERKALERLLKWEQTNYALRAAPREAKDACRAQHQQSIYDLAEAAEKLRKARELIKTRAPP
jgi:hypothetical protein